MKQKVIVTQLTITTKGQVKYFQIRIPKDVKQIIGIETSVRLIKIPTVALA
jgi:hypothetical protein